MISSFFCHGVIHTQFHMLDNETKLPDNLVLFRLEAEINQTAANFRKRHFPNVTRSLEVCRMLVLFIRFNLMN